MNLPKKRPAFEKFRGELGLCIGECLETCLTVFQLESGIVKSEQSDTGAEIVSAEIRVTVETGTGLGHRRTTPAGLRVGDGWRHQRGQPKQTNSDPRLGTSFVVHVR